ncbi:MAG: 50S ribosomal protein L15 [Candidatus Eremiobacteraeota bacterium]|nr:50S ribosomal protein L15 [Candidatus Eremiobacteraeota bacterium]
MAQSKPSAKPKASRRKAPVAHAASPGSTPAVSRGDGLAGSTPGTTLASLRENAGARPKRVRIGRGHGSGMVKTGGEGGKGQTVRSGGGKGPAFEGGQTPWARRLPHRRGYSQKARDIGHFRSTYAVVNLDALAEWDVAIEVSPQTLVAMRIVSKAPDGIKILGGNKAGKALPGGLRFRDVVFSVSAREALLAVGAALGDDEGDVAPRGGDEVAAGPA